MRKNKYTSKKVEKDIKFKLLVYLTLDIYIFKRIIKCLMIVRSNMLKFYVTVISLINCIYYTSTLCLLEPVAASKVRIEPTAWWLLISVHVSAKQRRRSERGYGRTSIYASESEHTWWQNRRTCLLLGGIGRIVRRRFLLVFGLRRSSKRPDSSLPFFGRLYCLSSKSI